MHIVVASKEEVSAVRKVMRNYKSLIGSIPTYRGDFVEPKNLSEYIAMWELFDMPVWVSATTSLADQFPDWAGDWEDQQEDY